MSGTSVRPAAPPGAGHDDLQLRCPGAASLLALGAVALVAVAALVLIAPRTAEAHAIWVRSDPAPNAQLQAPPSVVTAYFSEALDTRLSSIEVVDQDGERVDDGEPQFGPEAERMAIGIEGTLGPGFYTVIWETLSSVDGHLFKGSFPFTVLNEDGSVPEGAPFQGVSSGGTTAAPDTVLVKWSQIVAAAALVGSLAFAAWVVRPSLREIEGEWRERWAEAARQRLLWVALPASAAMVLVAIGELYVQADQLGGTEFLDDALRNNWGERWIQRQIVLAGICVTLAAGVFVSTTGRRAFVDAANWVALASGSVYLLLIADVSHGSGGPGSFWAVGADFLHLLATAVWIGMLGQLALFLVWLRMDIPQDVRTELQYGHLQRFSAIAATSVVILLATGSVNATTQVPDFEALFDTAYGRSLLVKLGIMAALLAVAGVNAFYLRPRTVEEGDEGQPTDELRRRMSIAVRAELALGLAVIAAAAFLILYPTSRQIRDAEAFEAQGAQAVVGYEETQPAGDIEVTLTVSPNTPGQNSFRVFLLPREGGDVGEVLRTRLRFTSRDSDLGQAELVLERVGNSLAYQGVGAFLSQPGNWDIDVDVRRAEVDDVTAVFPVPVSAPGAGGGAYELPITVGSWATVIAASLLVLALLAAIWTTQWPGFPVPAPRLARVGTAALGVVGAGLVVVTLVPTGGTASGNPIDPTDESIAIGRSLYTLNCQVCHGETGRGDGTGASDLPVMPADFRDHIPYHRDEFFFRVITNGLGDIMPSFGAQLTEDERWHLINFLHSEFGDAE